MLYFCEKLPESAKTIAGLFPPNSKVTRFKLVLAEASMMTLPTAVDPVKATLSIFGWLEIALPAVLPNPGKILSAPGGNPATYNH